MNNVVPNKAHFALAELEKEFEVQIITQNVDDLNERWLDRMFCICKGELKRKGGMEMQVSSFDSGKRHSSGAIYVKKGFQLRPHIVVWRRVDSG
ncbi:MAG: hypothetical protein IPI52_05575 [Bacteroidetes bacterium]|nr:hypothetical protein [Bacteroidota bacterium]